MPCIYLLVDKTTNLQGTFNEIWRKHGISQKLALNNSFHHLTEDQV